MSHAQIHPSRSLYASATEEPLPARAGGIDDAGAAEWRKRVPTWLAPSGSSGQNSTSRSSGHLQGNSYRGGWNSLFPALVSLFSLGNSLFAYAGNWIKSPDCIGTIRDFGSRKSPSFAKFPVFFPVIRELGAETGSRSTGSSASQSHLPGPFPFLGNTSDTFGR